MFFPVATLPMSQREEEAILALTGCSKLHIDTLLAFADKYRSSMTSDTVQKNRKLGTRALVRIARKLVQYRENADLYTLLCHSVLAEFLPKAERINLDAIFDEVGIKKLTPPVRRYPQSMCTWIN